MKRLLTMIIPFIFLVHISAATMLPQAGNPINTELNNYRKYLTGDPDGDKKYSDIVVSYQFKNGAFPKSGFDHEYRKGKIATESERDAVEKYRRSLGTFDNLSTTTELATLGHTYERFKDASHKAAAQRTIEWILGAQHSTGGWPQWYKPRSKDHYSAHATFNDDGMARVLISLQKALRKEDPFDSDIFTPDQLARCEKAIEKGVDYILKSQIKTGGKLTVWCAQHGMDDYKPKTAREYELPSKSGNESVLVTAFLMSRPQTPEITKAVKAALAWYSDPEVYVKDKIYVRPKRGDGRKEEVFVDAPGRKMWYRFYELETNKGFFCDKGSGGKKLYNYNDLKDDRYYGYAWAGPWGEPLLAYAQNVGSIE